MNPCRPASPSAHSLPRSHRPCRAFLWGQRRIPKPNRPPRVCLWAGAPPARARSCSHNIGFSPTTAPGPMPRVASAGGSSGQIWVRGLPLPGSRDGDFFQVHRALPAPLWNARRSLSSFPFPGGWEGPWVSTSPQGGAERTLPSQGPCHQGLWEVSPQSCHLEGRWTGPAWLCPSAQGCHPDTHACAPRSGWSWAPCSHAQPLRLKRMEAEWTDLQTRA